MYYSRVNVPALRLIRLLPHFRFRTATASSNCNSSRSESTFGARRQRSTRTRKRHPFFHPAFILDIKIPGVEQVKQDKESSVLHSLPESPPRTHMELLGLPFELVLDIWDSIEKLSDKDAFVRTCRFLYDNFNSRLYRQGITQGCRKGVDRAIRKCGESTLKKMLDAGLDPNDPFWGEEPLLLKAVESGLTENASVLIGAGADVNAKERFGNSIASSAVFAGHAEVLQLLFEKGASINFRVYEESPLLIAIQHGHESVVEVLLAHNAPVDEPGTEDADHGTPLAWAARAPHESIFYRLLRAGAKTSSSTQNNETLFLWAIQGGNDRIVSTLLEEGADPHAVDYSGCSVLMWACRAHRSYRSPKIIKLLLQHNVDIERKTNAFCDTALNFAARRGFSEAVDILLENNANPSTTNAKGQSSLHCAVKRGYTDIVSALIEHAQRNGDGSSFKEFIDQPDALGRTPLLFATLYALRDIVELLLYYGSSGKETASAAGRTPLSIIRAQMETEHGAKSDSVRHIRDLLQGEATVSIDKDQGTPQTNEWESYEATCDACNEPISPYDMHYHCPICDGNNYDICQECVCSGRSCYDRTHTWRKTVIVNGNWKEISDSLDQDSIVDELANLRIS